MSNLVWEEIKELTKEYNDKYKVEDDKTPAGGLYTPAGMASAYYTCGGWIRAEKDNSGSYIIKKGSLFPKDKFRELLSELENEYGVSFNEGSYGTNWTPFYVKFN